MNQLKLLLIPSGGTMKTFTINRFELYNIISSLSIMFFILFFALNQMAYGAGTSSQPSSGASSAADKRDRANVYFEAGKKLQETGDFKEASRQYELAVKSDPDYAEAYSNLGYSYRKQGRFEDAVRAYKKAISLKPDLAEAHEYLGEAYAEMGKFELAEKELKILRELGSDEAGELEEFIKKMKAKNG